MIFFSIKNTFGQTYLTVESIFIGMVAMPQPTVQYVQLGQTPNMAHPVMQYNGKLTFIKVTFNQVNYRLVCS